MVCAPCAAINLAISAPMPRLAPVTTATLPVRSNRSDAVMGVVLVKSAMGYQMPVAGAVQMRRCVVTQQAVLFGTDGNACHRGVDQWPADREGLFERRMQQCIDGDGDVTAGGECPDSARIMCGELLQAIEHTLAKARPSAGIFVVEVSTGPTR